MSAGCDTAAAGCVAAAKKAGAAGADQRSPAISYCTNIHPGESWQEMRAAVCLNAPVLRQALSPERPFPIGLRLSGRAAAELSTEEALDFHHWCREHGFYVATLNGFPYGTFHHTPIKQAVYLPDWRHAERLDYTRKLAALLALWLPDGMTGSISTVPLGFGSCIKPGDYPLIRQHISAALDCLDELAQKTGKDILLALEPEPGCAVETTSEVVELFDRLELAPTRRARLAICYDCCHQALQFEDPAESLRLLAANDIRIGHVQVSTALRLQDPRIDLLAGFQEPCYLHQTVGRKADGSLLRYDDLDQAIAAAPEGVDEWRVHFHVPVYTDTAGQCGSTRFFLERILPLFPDSVPLEVETYTWSILPPELQGGSVTDCLIREIEWVTAHSGK